MKIIIIFLLCFLSLVSFSQTGQDRKGVNGNEQFVATTTSLSATAAIAATFHNVITITNPVGSGANIHLDYIQFFMSGLNLMIPTSSYIYKNPTLVTTNIAPTNNCKIGSTITDNTTIVGYDLRTTGLTGSTGFPYEIPQNSGDKFGGGKLELMEGQSVGIDLSKAVGLGVALTSGVLMVYYHKLPS